MAQGANLRTSMQQACYAEASVKVHLRYGQLRLADVKDAVGAMDTAKVGARPIGRAWRDDPWAVDVCSLGAG